MIEEFYFMIFFVPYNAAFFHPLAWTYMRLSGQSAPQFKADPIPTLDWYKISFRIIKYQLTW